MWIKNFEFLLKRVLGILGGQEYRLGLMTWSLTYTQAADGAGGSRVDGFQTYFFDTFLSGRSGFTVGAGSDAFERVVTMTFNDIKGGTSSSYLWYNWSSTAGINCTQYENEAYSTTPGDNGNLSTGNTIGVTTPPAGGDWRIWESDEKTDAFLVTKGKVGQWFWPGVGSGKWNLYRGTAWASGSDNPNTCVGWASEINRLPYSNAPMTSSGSSTEYRLNPSVSNLGSTYGGLEAAFLFEGVGFNYSEDTLTESGGRARSTPCIPGGASDQGVYMPSNIAVYPASVDLNNAQLIQNTTNNKYYYYMGSDLSQSTFVLDFGTTEPIFT